MANELTRVSENGDGTELVLSPEIQTIVDRVKATGRYGSGTAFIMQALNAATIEEATDIGTVISGKEHVNERIRYLGVQFMDSDPDLDSPIPVYAICDVVREMGDGVVEKMSIGAAHVLGVLIRACELDWFPFDAELVTVELGKGRKAINLQVAPDRVENVADF